MNVNRPHKAQNAVIEELRFPAAVLPKIDGVRGINILPVFTGRTLKTFRNDNVTAYFTHPLLAGLDGELACGSITSPTLCRDTTSYVNSHAYNASGIFPDWYVFDYVTPETAGLGYYARWQLLCKHMENLHNEAIYGSKFQNVKLVPEFTICNNIDEVMAAHIEFCARGFEGTIIRYLHAPHKNGRSTVKEGAYMRIKEFASEEARILDFAEAQTNLNPAERNALGYTERSSAKDGKIGNGMIGSLIVERISDGEIITIGPGSLSHAERAEYFEFPERILGRTCTFKHMPYGAKDKPRFPLFANFRAEEDL